MLIDNRLARLFYVVAEELHFGRAAKRLFISQPPLSQAIRQLEQDLNATLFTRTTRSVSLTKAGQHLFEYLQQAEQDTLHLRSSLKHITQGKQGVVRLGITPSGTYSKFPAVLRYFKKYHPTIVLNVVESSTEIMSEQLQRGALDIAFMRPLTYIEGLQHQVLYREPLCLAVSHDHPLAQKGQITREDLSAEPLITYDPIQSPYFQHLTTQWLGEMKVAIQPVQESVIPTILALVDGGLGAALVPSAFAQFNTFGLHYIPLVDAQKHLAELSLVWRNDESDALVLFVTKQLLKNRAIFSYETDEFKV